MKCLAIFNFLFHGCAHLKSLFRKQFRKQDEKEIIYRLPTKVIKTIDKDSDLPYNGLPEFLYRNMTQNLKKEALIFAPTGETVITSVLLSESLRFSKFLTDQGIKPGDMVMILSENNIKVPPAFIGTCLYGAIIASVDPDMEYNDIKHLLGILKPSILFVSASQTRRIQKMRRILKNIFQVYVLEEIVSYGSGGVLGDIEPYTPKSLDSVALVVFSSGITGAPKAVKVSHNYVMYHAIRPYFSRYVDFSPLCLHFSVLLFMSSISYGVTRVIIPRFSPRSVWKFADLYKVNYLYLNYYELHKLLQKKPEVQHLPQYIVIHGDVITENDLLEIKDILPKAQIICEYEKAELGFSFRTTTVHNSEDKKLTVGVPKLGLEYKIVDLDSHTNLGIDQKGELRIKTKYAFSGYHNEKWTSQWDQEGFLKTGDIAYYDKDFCFYIIDRVESTFKSNDKRVFPGVLECILRSHDDVDMATVLGVPDAMNIYHPIAVIVLKRIADVNWKEILKSVNRAVGKHEKLTAVLLADSLPITFSRKINHRNLYNQQETHG